VGWYPEGYITTTDLSRVMTNYKKSIKRKDSSVKSEAVDA
jgi:hypothetical protein